MVERVRESSPMVRAANGPGAPTCVTARGEDVDQAEIDEYW